MLVTKNDIENNIIEMINVSSIKGKENKLIYNSNIIIKEYRPLPVPTFAKLDTIYLLDNFKELEKYVAFNGTKFEKTEFEGIIKQRYEYLNKYTKCKYVVLTEGDFKKINNIKNLTESKY